MANKPLSLSLCLVDVFWDTVYLFILRIFLPRDAMLQCGLCCWQLSKDWLSDQLQEKTVSINKEVSLLLELLNL